MQEIVTRQRLSLGLLAALAAVAIPAAGGLIAWGQNATRVQEIERHVDYQDAQVQTLRGQVGETQRAIAVADAQYSEIIRRLDQIDHKLEAAK